MSSNVIALRPSDQILEAAWEEYAVAMREAAAISVDPKSNSAERYIAAAKAARLHAEFTRLFKRACR